MTVLTVVPAGHRATSLVVGGVPGTAGIPGTAGTPGTPGSTGGGGGNGKANPKQRDLRVPVHLRVPVPTKKNCLLFLYKEKNRVS